MSARLILDRLLPLGNRVTRQGDRLAVQPKERLTAELRQAIKEHKTELIQLITNDQIASKGTKNEDRPNRPEDCEGPPYPNERGMVKCCCCERLVENTCQASRKRMSGIALLSTCDNFVMQADYQQPWHTKEQNHGF